MNHPYKICVIPGDGVGQEVIPEALEILEHLALDFELVMADAGYDAYLKYGSPLPEETIKKCREADAILFGAVTTPPNIKNYASPIVALRKKLNLFANLRPCISLPLKDLQKNIDIILVRENTEGLYSGRERKIKGGVVSERVITKKASERIIHFAFELAKSQKRKRVTLVHKANVIRMADGLFLEIGRRIAQEYKNINFEEALVDSCAFRLARRPQDFDVIVTTNMFGDILSDLTSAFVGGLGVVPSGNIGVKQGLFEPVHGSAPKKQGKNTVNPLATFFSVAMMLDFLGRKKEAERLRKSIFKTCKNNQVTPDLGGKLSTKQVTQAIIKYLN